MKTSVKYYLINLKRRPDRLENFKNICPISFDKINVIEAVDGNNLKNKEKPDYFHRLNYGEIGCFLSHKLIWEKIADDTETEYAVIFEDDPIFSDKFIDCFNYVLKNFLNFDSILYLGGRFTKDYYMKTCIKINDNIVKYDYSKPWDAWDCDRTTHAYIINKSTCKLMLRYFNILCNRENFKFLPIDHFILQVLKDAKKDIYSSYPLICHSDINSPDSDIR